MYINGDNPLLISDEQAFHSFVEKQFELSLRMVQFFIRYHEKFSQNINATSSYIHTCQNLSENSYTSL